MPQFGEYSNNSKRGSQWRRWDLHIHAPGTKLADGYGGFNDNGIKEYLGILEASDVQAFGITDYFSFDSYFNVVESYSKIYPSGRKVFFPNIEFRLTETVGSEGKNVHTHVLFDNDPETCSREILNKFLANLETHITKDGLVVRCNELKINDYAKATVSISALRKALEDVFVNKNSFMIVTAGNNDGLRGVDTKSPRSMSISDELDKLSHAFFGGQKNIEYFLDKNRYEDDIDAEPKPVFTGSDAHSIADLERLTGDVATFDPLWIKSDLTFRGLRQTLFEPQGRVFIGDTPSVLVRQSREATRFISNLNLSKVAHYENENGSWFENVSIPLNPELTAIIGNKGSGKSAIADIIALLAESRMEKYFSFLTYDANNKKFRRPGYAENFQGELVWESSISSSKKLSKKVDSTKPEAVKYLPQNYFESLTNEIEVKALRTEIEEVVFSHVDEASRLEQSCFKDLEELKTAQSKIEISALKTKLRELNIDLIKLEEEADAENLRSLQEQLLTKKAEFEVLVASKPAEVKKPDVETDDQKDVSNEITKLSQTLNALLQSRGAAVDELTQYKTTLQKLGDVKEKVIANVARIDTVKEELKLSYSELGLNFDKMINLNINLSDVEVKIKEYSSKVELLQNKSEIDFANKPEYEQITSIPDLEVASNFVSEKIELLKETLSAPQKRYQKYLQALNEIEVKQNEVMGHEEEPKPGTIKYLEKQLHYIENNLQLLIKDKIEARENLCSLIFAQKVKVRKFYEGLKSSVEELLDSVSSIDFKVTIDASFVLEQDFTTEFFNHINQSVKGYFRGSEDGMKALQGLISLVDWNDSSTIISFINSIVEKIKTEPVNAQIADLKKFYDFLYSFEYFGAKYELRLGGKELNQLSPGEKGLLLLVFYLHLDKEKTPLIIDQPEDNLDNDSIFSVLANCIREAKKSRQVILVTHNPNLAVGADAEQILYVTLEKHNNYNFTCKSGAIENPFINAAIVKVLEGSRPAFVQRRLKYQIN
tara:strand:- start:163 stop:3159 length:2997 start_codon:yes stop_codon:yes gene_type:complete